MKKQTGVTPRGKPVAGQEQIGHSKQRSGSQNLPGSEGEFRNRWGWYLKIRVRNPYSQMKASNQFRVLMNRYYVSYKIYR